MQVRVLSWAPETASDKNLTLFCFIFGYGLGTLHIVIDFCSKWYVKYAIFVAGVTVNISNDNKFSSLVTYKLLILYMFTNQTKSTIMKKIVYALLSLCIFVACSSASDASLLIEAESFSEKGGWSVDQQFTFLSLIHI